MIGLGFRMFWGAFAISMCFLIQLIGGTPSACGQAANTPQHPEYAEAEGDKPVKAVFDWLKQQHQVMRQYPFEARYMDRAQRARLKSLLDQFNSPSDLALLGYCCLSYQRDQQLDFEAPPCSDAFMECLGRLQAQTNTVAIDGLHRLRSHPTVDGHLGETITEALDEQNRRIRERMAQESTLPLLQAARKGDLEQVRELLNQGADVNAEDPRRGGTPLHEAAYWGRRDVAALLLEKGAKADADKNYSPLHDAAWRGNTEVAELLQEKGAAINQVGAVCTPLQNAVEKNRIKTAELLIAKGADLHGPEPYLANRLLDLAAERGHVEMIRLLLAHGLKVNGFGFRNEPRPLRLAADNGNTTAVAYLLDQGADIHYRGEKYGDRYDQDAILGSAVRGHKETFDLLLARGAKVDLNVALSAAAETGNLELVKELVDKGGNVNGEGKQEPAPLEGAIRSGKLDVVRYLVQKGADPKKRGYLGTPLLFTSVMYNYKDIADYLLAQGLEINARDDLGRTPLLDGWYCAGQSRKTMIEFLAARGADLKARDGSRERTLLHVAAEDGDLEAVEYLVHAGAEINARDKEGKTPMDYAPDKDIWDFLRSHGGRPGESKGK